MSKLFAFLEGEEENRFEIQALGGEEPQHWLFEQGKGRNRCQGVSDNITFLKKSTEKRAGRARANNIA